MSVSPGEAESSSAGEVDFLDLCTSNVRIVEKILAKGESLLNRRQCQDLSSKLSQTVGNIREVVSHSGASRTLFRPALTNMYRYLVKAKLLVANCAEKDWCAAAVFQCQNENAFRVILLEVGLCYNAIYELAKSHRKERSDHPEDLRKSSVFDPATDGDVLEDKEDLQKRLDEVASGDTNLEGLAYCIPWGLPYWIPWWLAYCVAYWIPWRDARRPSLAKYLLDKMHCTSSQAQANVLDTYNPILWRKASEPSGTWGSSHFLGSGSGASGVCSTTWLGVRCAKKEFHGQEYESSFMKEAGILAHLKHPNIVNFICCGNGLERGDRFIAMELMEMSLSDLIEKHKQKDEHFSILVAVDMMMQIAYGVCYLHGQGVAHRDLKPHNVVLNQLSSPQLGDYYCLKLVDFGVSKVEVEASKPNTMTTIGLGTWMYRAPEVHPKANPKSKGLGKVNWLKADAFSFAMTCAHLLSLETPFRDTLPNELYNKVTKYGSRPRIHEMYPKDLVVLLKDCWKTNPSSRPSFADICKRLEIIQHKYLRTHLALAEGMKKDTSDTNESSDFIKRSFDSFIKNPGGDEVELFYGQPKPTWVINNRRRSMGGSMTDPYYQSSGMTSGSYGGQNYGYNSSDVTVRTPLQGMTDVARIKHVLAVEGVYNVVCDIPQQSVTVSSNLSPRVVVGLIRQAMGSANIINYVDPLQPTFAAPRDRARYSSYDDSYSYDGRTGYSPAYSAPYNRRSYDSEFRPSSYGIYRDRSIYRSSYY